MRTLVETLHFNVSTNFFDEVLADLHITSLEIVLAKLNVSKPENLYA
ncbi:hypothetical protein [Nostoc sp.]